MYQSRNLAAADTIVTSMGLASSANEAPETSGRTPRSNWEYDVADEHGYGLSMHQA